MSVIPIPRRSLCGHTGPSDLPVCEACLRETLGEQVLARTALIAARHKPVLIQGETGSGKTLLAEYLHGISPRSGGPLQKRGCGDFPPTTAASVLFGAIAGAFTDARDRAGILEKLDGGSLILDDIDYMPVELQQALLGFLDDGKFFRTGDTQVERRADVRIIATTNKDLDALAVSQRFLPDLLARLNRFTLRLPPLRERSAAVERIAEFLLTDSARQINRPAGFWKLDVAAVRMMAALPWNRNVRELQTLVETLTVFTRPGGGWITALDVAAALEEAGLPAPGKSDPPVAPASPAPPARGNHHPLGEQIYRAFREAQGNVALAARIANCSRTTVYKHIRQNDWRV